MQNDHGGGITDAIASYGGASGDWLDLSTGINPNPYPLPTIPALSWCRLPDQAEFEALEQAAREFWRIPDSWSVLAVPGASSAIAQIPGLVPAGRVFVPQPTYNEHLTAFERFGWQSCQTDPDATVIVNPNNPDGRTHVPGTIAPQRLTVIDESFADVDPEISWVGQVSATNTIVLKSFGKFWGLAGLRLGFALGDPELIEKLCNALGPWQVSGPALQIGAAALNDIGWAENTRKELSTSAERLDTLVKVAGFKVVGGTSLFRLYEVQSAEAVFKYFAQKRILTRIFPYSNTWVRLGLPGSEKEWARLEDAL